MTVIALAAGATRLLTAKPADLDAQRREQQVQDLADADERGCSATPFHPDRGDRYLFHLGEDINALLGDQRAQPPQQP